MYAAPGVQLPFMRVKADFTEFAVEYDKNCQQAYPGNIYPAYLQGGGFIG